MKANILGVEIDRITLPEVLEKIERFLESPKQHYLVTPNPEFVMAALKDKEFRQVLNKADIAIPDGIGLLFAGWVLGEPIKRRVTGVALTWALIKLAEQKKCSVYLLGATEGVAKEAARKLKEKFPNLKIVGAESGGRIMNYELRIMNKELIARINKVKPDILLVAFGQVKQEKWIVNNLPHLPSVRVAVGVGGTLDYISGKVKWPPKIVRALGLEWLYRLIKEPHRWKRIWTAVVKFPLTVIKWKIRMRFKFRRNVAGCILNKEDQVLIVRRKDWREHWQIPQGGRDKGETPEEAVIREMSEELGLSPDKLKMIKKISESYKYVWPRWHQLLNGYRGQKQTILILRFLGENRDITPDKREISDFKWVKKHELVKAVHELRRELAELILKYL